MLFFLSFPPDVVVNQKYEAEILTEYVINGNAGILKCNIPSFVADFVQVESWIRDDGVVYKHTEKDDFGRVTFEMLYGLDEDSCCAMKASSVNSRLVPILIT